MALRHPLFVSGPSGGVVEPQDARLALASLLTGPGILNGGAVTGSTSGPNMIYSVAAGSFVTARGIAATDGLYVVPNDGPVTVDSGSPAPGSGTRWDLIWVRCLNAYDGGFGDANSDPVFGVTVGAAGSSPSKPYSSVPAGALVLAESEVGTSIASASLATISMVAAATGTTPFPQPLFIATGSTASTIAASGAWTQIFNWATPTIDTYSGWDASGQLYHPQLAGWYRLTLRMGLASSPGASYVGVGFGVNSATLTPSTQVTIPTASTNPVVQTTTVQYSPVGGPYFRPMGIQGSAAAINTNPALCEFTAEWLHA